MRSIDTVTCMGLTLLAVVVATGCEGAVSDDPVPASIYTLAAFDPDFTEPTAPVAGRIVWVPTRAGTGRFLVDDRELVDVARVSVDGGELVTTAFPPALLLPGYNDIEIRFALEQHGSTEISAVARLLVSAECTAHDHCARGACVDFVCTE